MNKSNSFRNVIIILVGIIIILLIVLGFQVSSTDKDSQNPTREQNSNESATSGISKARAEQIATDKYSGTVKSTEDDSYKGAPAWEVELKDSNKGRIEVKVDKKTGEILHYESD